MSIAKLLIRKMMRWPSLLLVSDSQHLHFSSMHYLGSWASSTVSIADQFDSHAIRTLYSAAPLLPKWLYDCGRSGRGARVAVFVRILL